VHFLFVPAKVLEQIILVYKWVFFIMLLASVSIAVCAGKREVPSHAAGPSSYFALPLTLMRIDL